MTHALRPMPPGAVQLLPSPFQQRFDLNLRYVMSLRSENLLQNHYLEAGLWDTRQQPEGCHWGWESPTSQLRGQFLGHWLSAAARIYAHTHDAEVKAKADHIVAELGRCQAANGGEWVGSIPEKYLTWLAQGRPVKAPQYVLHKTLMGLHEMAAHTGNNQALDILEKWARWFYRWTSQFSRKQLDDMLDVETGGMMEVWADVYQLTGRQEHLELMRHYERLRLFDRLLAGEDMLTNTHANTTIPEVHGAARAWEVTGEARFRAVVEAYWQLAVVERGAYCTGGQTCGELWTPPGQLSARLGDNQEHCTVYNMMRLAEYLFRWSGEAACADYWERNLYNGILAQQHPETGMVTYFLPLHAGAVKHWGSPMRDFWCCHGTLVQAHTAYAGNIYAEDDAGLVVCQVIPSELTWQRAEGPITVTLQLDPHSESVRRPNSLAYELAVACQQPQAFTLKLRLPWWLGDEPLIAVNGERQSAPATPSSFVSIHRTWGRDVVHIELPKQLTVCPLPDAPNLVAFMDGPVVLTGLCAEERALYGDPSHPESFLTPDNERDWMGWRPGYRARGQPRGLRFIPLHQVRDEAYTVYFPIRPAETSTLDG
jgi:DUF1680 family protein